jgi:hypothetical protein
MLFSIYAVGRCSRAAFHAFSMARSAGQTQSIRWKASRSPAGSTTAIAFRCRALLSVGESRPSHVDPTNDVVWNTIVALKIVAHPELNAAQKKAIERDFGMKDGVLVLNFRVALAYYVMRRLNLDLIEWKIPPERQQIFLANAAEVEEIKRKARKRKPASRPPHQSREGIRNTFRLLRTRRQWCRRRGKHNWPCS